MGCPGGRDGVVLSESVWPLWAMPLGKAFSHQIPKLSKFPYSGTTAPEEQNVLFSVARQGHEAAWHCDVQCCCSA